MHTKRRVVHVHDVWDGRLFGELQEMPLELDITTSEPGYNRLKLTDYIKQYQPIAVIINTPLLGDVISMARAATHLPVIYVASQRLVDMTEVERLPIERVLWRETLTDLDLIEALHDCLAELPVHS